jgi:hypothetical protein
MFDDDADPLRDIADRVIRKTLQHPTNLEAFLSDALSNWKTGFDFKKAKEVSREFLLDDWRGREADMFFEVPYRFADGERKAIVCVLIEHQTRPDSRAPFRTLLYTTLYWDREWRRWKLLEPPRPNFRLTPIVPIVLHTSPQRWTGARKIADILGEPSEFHVFAPKWEPLFWELASRTSRELLDSRDAFFQFLSVVRAEDDSMEEFGPVYVESVQRLGLLHDTDHVLWTDMLNAVLTWASTRRPREEKDHWQSIAESIQEDERRKREVRNMGQTIAQSIYEEGRLEGEREGERKGERKGQFKGIQKLLFELGEDRFGPPDESTRNAICAIDDVEQLTALSHGILTAQSWSDLLKNR